MAKIGAGEIIYDLRKQIQEIQSDLNQLGNTPDDVPELVDSANLIRINEYLSKTNEQKSKLISAYGRYSGALEELLSSVFEIQQDLKEILKEQSSLLSKPSKKKLSSKTTKSKKK